MTNERFLSVTDPSATEEAPKRSHSVILNGEIKTVDFEYGKPTILPYELGAKFIQTGFIVADSDGLSVSAPPITNDAILFQLGEDEVIARYEELTLESLQLRAIKMPEGERFVEVTEENRVELVNFLKSGRADYLAENDDEDLEVELEFDEDNATADVTDNVPTGIAQPLPAFSNQIIVTEDDDAIEVDTDAVVNAEKQPEENKGA